MGLFGFGKPKDKIVEWLNEADKMYVKAFETRDIVILKNWFSRDCCIKLSRVIVATASTRLFVADSFKDTSWECIEKDDNTATYQKVVKYDGVKIASYKMAVGEDYEETWYVDILGKNSYIVSNIVPKEKEESW